MPFKKGKTGNPKGRPKKPPEAVEAEALARQYCPHAVGTLAEIMLNKKLDPKARVIAANAILDRGYGKARQPVDIDQNLTMYVLRDKPLSPAEWAAEYAESPRVGAATRPAKRTH